MINTWFLTPSVQSSRCRVDIWLGSKLGSSSLLNEHERAHGKQIDIKDIPYPLEVRMLASIRLLFKWSWPLIALCILELRSTS